MTNSTTTYTTLDHDGDVLNQGLSLSEAADEIMRSDGREWDIREYETGGYHVWTRQQVANIGWKICWGISSNEDNIDDATHEICKHIVNAERWAGHCHAMTDAAYKEMKAQFEADMAEDE